MLVWSTNEMKLEILLDKIPIDIGINSTNYFQFSASADSENKISLKWASDLHHTATT